MLQQQISLIIGMYFFLSIFSIFRYIIFISNFDNCNYNYTYFILLVQPFAFIFCSLVMKCYLQRKRFKKIYQVLSIFTFIYTSYQEYYISYYSYSISKEDNCYDAFIAIRMLNMTNIYTYIILLCCSFINLHNVMNESELDSVHSETTNIICVQDIIPITIVKPINSKTCSICLDEDIDCKLLCDHSFHKRCLQEWFDTFEDKLEFNCPNCRKSFYED